MSAAAATMDGEGLCDLRGKFTQYQTVYGQCTEGKEKREADCEYVGPWQRTTSEDCPSDGKQQYFRHTKNSSKSTTKSENCDYYGEWYKTGGCGTDGKQWWERKTAVNGSANTERGQWDCCYEGPWEEAKIYIWGKGYDSVLIDEDADGNSVNHNGYYLGSHEPNHWKSYSLEKRDIAGNCPDGHPTERKTYECGRGSCRQYDKYWRWASNANLSKGGEGPCGSMYNCCERWEECEEDSNDYIKGPKGTQGDYQYSYNL
jgi:hypothetical protein